MFISRRSLFDISIVLLLIVIIGMLFFTRREKIAYVESARLLNNYKAMIDTRKEFEVKTKQWQANIDTLTQDVQRTMRQFEKEATAGSEKEKRMARELIGGKQKQLQEYQQAIQQNAQQEESRLTSQVISEINIFLTEYGKDHGYKMILVANNGNLAYADKGLDITDEIVNHLNKNYKVSAK